MTSIYLASSWRNPHQPTLVEYFRNQGLEVYDFRNPAGVDGDGEDTGFHWSEIDSDYKHWTSDDYIEALDDDIAKAGFKSDMDALKAADIVVLVNPCGRSAHLELGWAVGAGKETAIYLPQDDEVVPELMYSMVDLVTNDLDDLMAWLLVARA